MILTSPPPVFFGHFFTRFFQCALLAFVLALSSGVALAEKINLNTSNAETLEYIPGIGPGKAEKIIRMRDEIGSFNTMEELLTVSGIGEKILIEIKKYATLTGGVSALSDEMASNRPLKESGTHSSSESNSN